jgi:hypothetical protein
MEKLCTGMSFPIEKDSFKSPRSIGSTTPATTCRESHVSSSESFENPKNLMKIFKPGPVKGPVKRTPGRLPRIPFTTHQLSELEQAYKAATYLSTEEANKLAKKLELTGVRVKIWFQNRRARDRRERKYSKNGVEVSSDDNCDEIIVS